MAAAAKTSQISQLTLGRDYDYTLGPIITSCFLSISKTIKNTTDFVQFLFSND